MSRHEFSPRARRELYEIIDYISERSPAGARRVRLAIDRALEVVARNPSLGHRREDLTDRPLRFWTVMGRFTIIYRGDQPPIEVVHVVGPGRDITRLLS